MHRVLRPIDFVRATESADGLKVLGRITPDQHAQVTKILRDLEAKKAAFAPTLRIQDVIDTTITLYTLHRTRIAAEARFDEWLAKIDAS